MTEREPQLASAASARDYREILEGAHEAYVAMDAGGFIIDWNPQAETTFGYSQREVLGRVLADTIIPERYRDAHWQGLQRFLETGQGSVIGKRIEIEALHREGFEFPVELTISVHRSGSATFFNAFLHDISDRRRAELYVEAQHAVTSVLAHAQSEGEVIGGLLEELGQHMAWEYGAHWKLDPDAGSLACAETWTQDGARIADFVATSRETSFVPGEGLPGRVWATGHPSVIVDVVTDPNFPRAPAAEAAGLHSAICFPLLGPTGPVGVIEFLSEAIGQDDPELIELLDSISTQVGQHLSVLRERARLLTSMEAMARTDELTELPNRRAWEDALKRERARASRAGERFSIAMIDLDNFKDFNDAHGHQAGDQLLRQLGESWPTAIRAADFIARYGGEEFAVLLPGCPPGSAPEVVERIREATPLGRACSAGIAAWDGTESAEELVARADRALYEAKRGGRNRVVLAEDIE